MSTPSTPDPAVGAAGPEAEARLAALHADVERTLVQTIVDVVGKKAFDASAVTLDSTFSHDIGLESLDMIEIAERLIELYEGRVDFVAWLTELEFEDLVALTVGDVVAYIVRSLQATEAGAGPGSPPPAAGEPVSLATAGRDRG